VTRDFVLPEDVDAIADVALPRANQLLFGHHEAEQSFLTSFNAGRLAHAWLIGGEEGVGKATLAFRLARHVLAQSIAPERRRDVDQAIATLSHPDLVVIRRAIDQKRNVIRPQIRVEDVRKAMQRVVTTSTGDGWRVVIVDTVDDFNDYCGNALLKTIEEPPDRVLFFLLAHRPGKVQATIRSRCRRLTLAPLSDGAMQQAVTALLPSAASDVVAASIRYGHGSPGRALRLIAKNWLELVDDMDRLFDNLGAMSARDLAAFSDRLEGRAKDDAFRLFRETLSGFIATRAASLTRRTDGSERAARLAAVGQFADAQFASGTTFNLPRRHMIIAYLEELQRAL